MLAGHRVWSLGSLRTQVLPLSYTFCMRHGQDTWSPRTQHPLQSHQGSRSSSLARVSLGLIMFLCLPEASRTVLSPTSSLKSFVNCVHLIEPFLDKPLLGFPPFSPPHLVRPIQAKMYADNDLYEFISESLFQCCTGKILFQLQKQVERPSCLLPYNPWNHLGTHTLKNVVVEIIYDLGLGPSTPITVTEGEGLWLVGASSGELFANSGLVIWGPSLHLS